jgi:hypothetical protein
MPTDWQERIDAAIESERTTTYELSPTPSLT